MGREARSARARLSGPAQQEALLLEPGEGDVKGAARGPPASARAQLLQDARAVGAVPRTEDGRGGTSLVVTT